MNVVGIVTALRSEASCLTSDRLPYNRMVRLGEGTVMWLCGMGDSAARAAAAALVANNRVVALISFGGAGALDPRLRPGDLVLPEAIRTHNGKIQSVSLDWRNRLQQLLPPDLSIAGGTLVSSLSTLTSHVEKRELAVATGACAVDMESGAIAEVAANAKMPFLAIRAIIDPVEVSPPPALLKAVYPDGSVDTIRLLTLLWTRSVRLRPLLNLRIGMQAARNTLSLVIQHAGLELGRAAYRG